MAGKVRNYSSGRQSGAGSKPQSARRRKQQLAANEARLRLAVASVAAISMFASRTARATNYTWIGNTDSIWGDANWNPNATPGPSDAAIFSNAGDGNTSLSLQGVPYTIGNITFDTPFAAAYTIGSATDTLTLNNSGTILMTSLVANNQTFNTAITLGIDSTNQTFTFTNNSASNTLAFNGNITGNTSGGVKTLLVDGAGNTTISGVLAGGAAAADLGLTKLGTGTLTLNGSAVNTYTGATIASGGTLTLNFANLGATTNLINSGSALILAGGSLNVIGNPSNASAQTFNGTTFNPGMSVVSLSGSTAPTLTLGTYALTRGSTVEFVGPSEQNVLSGTGTDGSATATGTITTTNSGSGAVGLVWNASDSAIATVGLYDWASTDTTAGAAGTTIIGGSQVTGFYTQVANNGTVAIGSGNVDLLGNATLAAGSGTNTNYAATIRFNVAGNFTLNNNSGSNHSPQFGGFLITPNVGAHNITFANNATNNYAASENVTGLRDRYLSKQHRRRVPVER